MIFDYLDRHVKIYCSVTVRFGTVVPKGFLPVFSVDTEEEAKTLIIAACPFNGEEYYSDQLAERQDLETLSAFADHLARIWFDRMGQEPGRKVKEIPKRARKQHE